MPDATPAQIEAAARAIYEAGPGFELMKGKPWGELSESSRENKRRDARAALTAAAAVQPKRTAPTVAEVKAQALREAADDIAARANGPKLIEAVDRWGGYYGGVRTAMQNEEAALRLRADRIEKGEHP